MCAGSDMDRRKFYYPSLMTQDEIYDFLDSIVSNELDTNVENNFSDDKYKGRQLCYIQSVIIF